MRITSGQYKGRRLTIPNGKDVRPTSDKVRQALFNILLSYDLPVDAIVIDGFCGSGALGLEALSRGASHCTFIDKNTRPARENITALNDKDLNAACLFAQKDARKPGLRPVGQAPANLIFLDPPYHKDLIPPTLTALSESGWLADEALCVLEMEKAYTPDLPDTYTLLDNRDYGDTKIILCRYKSDPAK